MPTEFEDGLASICRDHGIALAYLFGSQAEKGLALLEGKAFLLGDSLTDLDLGVVTADPLPGPTARARLYAALHDGLADLFVPFCLDLSFLEENHSVFQLEAVGGICVYQRDEQTRDDYEMRILRRAADFRPFLDRYLHEALEEV